MLNVNLPFRHISLPRITSLSMKTIHRRTQTPRSHTPHCHRRGYCKVDFLSFHNVTCYTNDVLPRIHVNTTNVLNTTCTLVTTKQDIKECIIILLTRPTMVDCPTKDLYNNSFHKQTPSHHTITCNIHERPVLIGCRTLIHFQRPPLDLFPQDTTNKLDRTNQPTLSRS